MSTEIKAGDMVRFWPGAKTGRSLLGRTTSEPWNLCGTEVISVDTYSGGIALTHVEPVRVDDNGTVYVKTVAEALDVCTADGITDVVIEDNAERIKMQKLMRGLR